MTPSTDTPMREGSRDGQGGCLVCGKDTPSTRAKYCTRAHQQRSYRLRHQTPTADLTTVRKALQRRSALAAHTIYECGACGDQFVGVRRCESCNLFCRAVGVGGSCPACYDGIVPPRCDLHTLINVIFGPTGGLMVVAIVWPIARGDRQDPRSG